MATTEISTDPTERTTTRWVVSFDEGRGEQRQLLGGKGANLCAMTWLGLPVPPGFIVTTEACRAYLADGRLPDGLVEEVRDALTALEERTGRRLGDPDRPLLLSVRSGAPFSMPGMMDTVLDLGADASTRAGLAALGGAWFALDAQRRFVEMFGRVVQGVDEAELAGRVDGAVARAGVADERALDEDQLATLVAELEELVTERAGVMPHDPFEQLRMAIEAVFRSWNGARARSYRRLEGIPDDLGTAVNIQVMVFGNLDERSATGVAFSRDPATGENVPYGDFLDGAQGEDVVAGTRHPRPLAELAESFPDAHAELLDHMRTLESHDTDMCDVEFTIESDKLWMLQTRVGKRSAAAAVRIAVEMVDEGLIGEEDAIARVRPEQVEQLLHPRFATVPDRLLTSGLAASPGAAVGAVCLDTAEARDRGRAGESVILVRNETSPEDIDGMAAAAGLLTARGGLVSHAAVVARGMGKPAVCGASELRIDVGAGTVRVGEIEVRTGDTIAIDGTSGQVALGEVELELPGDDAWLDRLLEFADRHRRLHVYANADTAADAQRALDAGAEGIGLCRTEHQFLGDRLPLVQRLILADDEGDRHEALEELERVQRADFEALLEVMDGRTVVIRLLDPPLHEFLPNVDELRALAATGELDEEGRHQLDAAERLQEHNPMLGTRGIRLGVLRPEIYRTQVRAVVAAAVARRRAGGDPLPEIMLPLVATPQELAWGVALIRQAIGEVEHASEIGVHCTIATMIETPSAAVQAAALAPQVDAFSFGTNDLTQLTLGLSRDDVEASYIPAALAEGLFLVDPFRSLERDAVGRLVELAVRDGREAFPELITGICGEHGGDPDSIAFAHQVGLDHVSCAPSRLRVARLAAARAQLGIEGPDRTA